MTFERPAIARMEGYTPGEQLDDARVIKLNTNENPYPAPEAVATALRELSVAQLRRYPSPTAGAFREAAALYHGLSQENILPTNGGDELLRLIITTFADAGDVIAAAEPSYSLYPVLAAVQGCKFRRLPLDSDWNLPSDFADQLNALNAKIAFLVNPHAPTGKLMTSSAIMLLAEQYNGVLVVDEAYVDFIAPEENYNLCQQINSCKNLVILRTMSKGYSLAGLRFGYGIACKALIEPMLTKTRDSYNTDFISQKLALAAIQSAEEAAKSWLLVRQQREVLLLGLQELGFTVIPSQSNFLLAQTPSGSKAEDLYQQLKARHILVRYFDQPRLDDKLRITVGSAEENTKLLDCLRECLSLAGNSLE